MTSTMNVQRKEWCNYRNWLSRRDLSRKRESSIKSRDWRNRRSRDWWNRRRRDWWTRRKRDCSIKNSKQYTSLIWLMISKCWKSKKSLPSSVALLILMYSGHQIFQNLITNFSSSKFSLSLISRRRRLSRKRMGLCSMAIN